MPQFLLRCILMSSLLLGLGLVGFTQSDTIRNISFTGLKKTQDSYLRRFLQNQTGEPLDRQRTQNDVQQLRNLTNVAHASLEIDTTATGLALTYHIEEAITFFPIINFGGIRNNFWYQLGFTDLNWLGKGNQLTVYYQNIDRRHNGSIYYRVPYVNGSRWGFSLQALKWASREPLYFPQGAVFYYYDNLSFSGSLIRELEIGHTLEFVGTYFIENYEKTAEQSLLDPPGPEALREPKALFKLVHRYDRLNYHYFNVAGFENLFRWESVYNYRTGDWFHLVLNDTRYFQRLTKGGNLAMRLRLGISTNNTSPFAPFVLDSQVNIRGSGNRIDRGTATVILNAEYRQLFFETNLFAGQVVAFSDIGTWRNPGGTLEDLVQPSNFRHFVGGGLRFIYKKAFDGILRIDYGVDIYNFNERGFVLGVGQYF